MPSRERPIHLAILDYLRTRFPDAVIHHSANEVDLRGKDVARAIAKAKHMGMMVGFPDLMVWWRHWLFMFEVKAPGNYPKEAQKACGELIQANGGKWAVVRSVDDVEACLEAWIQGGPLDATIPLKGTAYPDKVVWK